MKSPRVAIIYDRINTFGGAEQVLLSLHKAFPQAALFASVWDRARSQWLGGWQVSPTFLQYFPLAKRHHQWFGWLMPLAFESLNLSGFDVVISVTSEAAKGVITNPAQLHICYCLTPTRYLWSHTHEYAGSHFRWLKQLLFSWLREWDYIAANRPDVIVPISTVVSERIRKYYNRQCEAVLYPPVTIATHTHKEDHALSEDYYLLVSRLVPYKRVKLAIDSCLKLHKKLKIVGNGTERARLLKYANGSPLIEFLGFVDAEKLDMIYAQSRALLMPQEEDFGIVALEALARGVPVISYNRSGAAETIQDGITGILFDTQSVFSMSAAIIACEGKAWDRKAIQRSVAHYDEAHFVRAFQALVQKYCRIESERESTYGAH